MEKLKKILEFLKVEPVDWGPGYPIGAGYGDGSGHGDIDGYGNGFGYGDGSGHGSFDVCDYDNPGYSYVDAYDEGYGYGSGQGSGFEDTGSAHGAGAGAGNDNGSGSGVVLGSGAGIGLKINQIKGNVVYYIDEIPTIFDYIYGNMAKGKIVNFEDFSLKPCYIAKNKYWFAHGETIKQALLNLEEITKYIINNNINILK